MIGFLVSEILNISGTISAKKNSDFAKELEMETEKENKPKEFVIENKLDKKWWNISAEG
ncbi:hypothetical protein YC2023_099150 [Brassica napus]